MMLDLTLSLISLMIVQVWASAKCVVRPRGDLQDNRALGDVLREPAIALQLDQYTDWEHRCWLMPASLLLSLAQTVWHFDKRMAGVK